MLDCLGVTKRGTELITWFILTNCNCLRLASLNFSFVLIQASTVIALCCQLHNNENFIWKFIPCCITYITEQWLILLHISQPHSCQWFDWLSMIWLKWFDRAMIDSLAYQSASFLSVNMWQKIANLNVVCKLIEVRNELHICFPMTCLHFIFYDVERQGLCMCY